MCWKSPKQNSGFPIQVQDPSPTVFPEEAGWGGEAAGTQTGA